MDKFHTDRQSFMQTHTATSKQVEKKKKKERERNRYSRRMQMTGPKTHNVDGRTNVHSLSPSHEQNKKNTYTLHGSLSTTFERLLRAWQNSPGFTDAKTKLLMEEMVSLHLPCLHLHLLQSSLCTCAAVVAGWRAGYSENIEWKAFSIQWISQSVSHPGKGDLDGGEQPGFRLWSPSVMTEPRAEKSRVSPLSRHHFPHFRHNPLSWTFLKFPAWMYWRILRAPLMNKTRCIRSGLPELGPRRWASRWMCSGSPAPIARSPSLCLAAGAGSLWMQRAACNSAGRGGQIKKKKQKKETESWRWINCTYTAS